MARMVKCRACGEKIDSSIAYVYLHYTKSGNLQKRYYCNREEFHEVYMDNEYYNRARRRVDKILGYVCVNNQKNKMLMNLYNSGYGRKDVYDCLVYYQNEIMTYMERKNIENEYQKLRYIFTVIENNIKDFSKYNKIEKQKKTVANDEWDLIEESTSIETTRKRKSIRDRLKGE